MKKQLEIKPVRRYHKAKYPAYTDPNPLETPQALPYPFSQRMLEWAMGIGLLGATACQGYAQEISNTFRFDQTGLPFMPAVYGTGLPDRLPGKEIREIVLRISKEEGLKVKEDVPWKYMDNHYKMLFPISVFDEEKKIGFAILDRDNIDRESLVDPAFYAYDKKPLFFPLLEALWRQFSDGDPNFSLRDWLDIRKQEHWNKEEKAFYQLFTKATFSGLSKKEEESGRWIFYKILIKHYYEDYREKKWYNKPAIEKAIDEKNEPALQQALELDIFIELLHEFVGEKDWKEKVVGRYIAEQREWLAQNPGQASNATIRLMRLKDSFFIDAEVKKSLQALFDDYKPQWKEILWDVYEQFQDSRFSLDEIKAMDYWAEEKQVFVAPISFQDDRFAFFYTPKELAEIIGLPVDSTEPKEIKKPTKDDAIKRLETSLRSYIHWAKLQGGY